MRRTLLILSALGLAASGLTTAKIFSATTDTAKIDGITIHSGEITPPPPPPGKTVDLQLAVMGEQECGTFSEDLTAPIDADFVLPVEGEPVESQIFGSFCLRNIGTSTATVRVSNIIDSSAEIDCSPGEAAADTTCSTGDAGELDDYTIWYFTDRGLDDPIAGGGWGTEDTLHDITVNAGAIVVFDVKGVFTTDTHSAESQSDRLLTHFIFNGSLA